MEKLKQRQLAVINYLQSSIQTLQRAAETSMENPNQKVKVHQCKQCSRLLEITEVPQPTFDEGPKAEPKLPQKSFLNQKLGQVINETVLNKDDQSSHPQH